MRRGSTIAIIVLMLVILGAAAIQLFLSASGK